jgi:glycerone phosphate O-acyltransferase/fatty acyl-CoA reductase
MNLIPSILRSCGAFFLKRESYENNPLYKAIFYEYLQRLLIDECYVEFFIEGGRSRTGKIMTPKFGLLSIVVDTVIDKKIPDATLIPMTINYEKVLEADTYPLELLGESKVKESLLRVLESVKLINSNYGRVYVEFGEPITI